MKLTEYKFWVLVFRVSSCTCTGFHGKGIGMREDTCLVIDRQQKQQARKSIALSSCENLIERVISQGSRLSVVRLAQVRKVAERLGCKEVTLARY